MPIAKGGIVRFWPTTLPAFRRFTALLLLWATLSVAAPMSLVGPGTASAGSAGSGGSEARLGSTGRGDHASRPGSAAFFWSGARSLGDGTLLQPVGAQPGTSVLAPEFVVLVTGLPETASASDLAVHAPRGRAPPVTPRA